MAPLAHCVTRPGRRPAVAERSARPVRHGFGAGSKRTVV